MSNSARPNSTVRLLYLMALYPIWKLIQAIIQNNTATIVIYTIVTCLYLSMCIYVARSNYNVKKYYKKKNAENLLKELNKKDED